ncbi:MAG TPA: ABC transporter permease subunit [Acidimicrobiales bacterium]|nr:ABC transporter permease subunit [Acidimicrobiales bacterium]
MTSVPTTGITETSTTTTPPRAAPHVRTYLAPSIVSLIFFFPTAIPAIVSAVKARRYVREENTRQARIHGDAARQWFWMTIGIGLTVWFCLFAVMTIFLNDKAVQRVFLNWGVISDSFPGIRKGFWLNVKLFMVAEVLVLIWSLFVAIMRGLPGKAAAPIRFLVIAYIDLFRALPAVIVIYMIVFGLPLTGLPIVENAPVFWLAVLALTLVYGAYVAEVYRSGIESVHWSQSASSRSLGLSYSETMRFVVVPQAVRRIIPPLLNDFISLQKDTALVGFVGVLDAFNRARIVAANRFNLSAVTGVAIAYIVITVPLAIVVDHLVKRDQKKMRANG